MTKYVIYALAAVIAISLGTFAIQSWIEAERNAAVEAERRERIADAVDLIRDTDKMLGVQRKASNSDLCRAMGGEPGECQ